MDINLFPNIFVEGNTVKDSNLLTESALPLDQAQGSEFKGLLEALATAESDKQAVSTELSPKNTISNVLFDDGLISLDKLDENEPQKIIENKEKNLFNSMDDKEVTFLDLKNLANKKAQPQVLKSYSENAPLKNNIIINQEASKQAQVVNSGEQHKVPVLSKDINEAKEILFESISSNSSDALDFTSGEKPQESFKVESRPLSTEFKISHTEIKNSDDLIKEVQNYIEQSRVATDKKVEMSFSHHELGKVDLVVEKGHQNVLDIKILPHTNDGVGFFTKHQQDLIQTLTQSGVQVSSLKVDIGSSSGSFAKDFNFDGNNSSQGQFSNQSHEHSNQRQSDHERRMELWKYLYDKEAA